MEPRSFFILFYVTSLFLVSQFSPVHSQGELDDDEAERVEEERKKHAHLRTTAPPPQHLGPHNKRVDDTVRAIAAAVREPVTEKARAAEVMVTDYTPITYKSLTVAGNGTIYFIKVRVNGSVRHGYAHVRVFVDQQGAKRFDGAEFQHASHNPIEFF